ncbi:MULTISPECIES: ABC transporter ATP-binding protein [Ramlibacter]|uniref:ATP-binding cassette domain-containing protein n=1 Tax=Ramlibacter pinisoli TaxID=2682844 RepID=A0A6N8IR36_9BURK|nr:ABC transporter ATP-binding protein [Ramlibacter sp. CGMCC 1.13660]MVQ28586.1 ATP-binding cassette domain-containing protein [Ramlibacter pinisoli]
MSNGYLSLSQVDMTFTGASGINQVLRNINLDVARGEYISLIGHSGCGKSTVLNIVAGLLRASSGGVIVDNREVDAPGPDRAVVFQNHSLLPWLTVYQNVEIAVEKIFGRTRTAAERREWVLHNLAMVNMTHALDRLPSEISGGMKQRVGIARALSMEPKVLLLDEPFGALDALTRAHLQDEVIRIQSELGNTVLMITHDVDEAVLMSDRVVMMTNGPSATIGQILPVPLERPRNRIALAEDKVYNHCRQEILTFLYEKQRKVETIHAGRSMKSLAKADVALRA